MKSNYKCDGCDKCPSLARCSELWRSQTHPLYEGIRFRSFMEMRWAVFFDACGVEWEYENHGFDLGDGIYYLPDFLLHGVKGRCGTACGDLYVEVKGQMDDASVEKIRRFSKLHPILVVGDLPKGATMTAIESDIAQISAIYELAATFPMFNFYSIDGKYGAAYPAIAYIDGGGYFAILDDETEGCMIGVDSLARATTYAYEKARSAKIDHDYQLSRAEIRYVTQNLVKTVLASKREAESPISHEMRVKVAQALGKEKPQP